MTQNSNNAFINLARVIKTLSKGTTVKLPYIMGSRNTAWSDHFRYGFDPVNEEDMVLIGNTRLCNNQVSQPVRDSACNWSLDDVLKYFQEIDEAEILATNLEELGEESGIIAQIAAIEGQPEGTFVEMLDDSWRVCLINGEWRLKPVNDGQWSFTEAVEQAISERTV